MKRKTLSRSMRIGLETVAATAALAVLPSGYVYASDLSNLDNNEGDRNLFYHKNSGTNTADIFKNYENGNGLKSTVSTAWCKVKLALAKMKYFYQGKDLNYETNAGTSATIKPYSLDAGSVDGANAIGIRFWDKDAETYHYKIIYVEGMSSARTLKLASIINYLNEVAGLNENAKDADGKKMPKPNGKIV